MNLQLLLLLIGTIIALLALVFIIKKQKLKKYYDRIKRAEINIDKYINNKITIIESINKILKKGNKKDYLKDYLEKLNDVDNYEKDNILNDCSLIIKDLIQDNKKMANNKELKILSKELKEVEEEIVANKIMFNNNLKKLVEENQKIIEKTVSTISKYKTKRYYDINKTDEGIN